MERLRGLKRSMPSSEYRCRYKKHPGKIPSVWEVDNKCVPEHCPWLMTKAEFDQWCDANKVYFIGG
jgi:hypothetical protein